MSRCYYDDLSANSSDEKSTDGSDDDDQVDRFSGAATDRSRLKRRSPSPRTESDNSDVQSSSILMRYILHMDVDCFYCQCECKDRSIPVDRPLAIGQKHIVVTSNYAARDYGVGKLQLRETAQQLCSHLLIVEGSDLERYRIHSRSIYQALRRVCKAMHPEVAVCKGSMDEAMVDLTAAVKAAEKLKNGYQLKQSTIYYFNQGDSASRSDLSRSNSSESRIVGANLELAADLALRIREAIREETGFATTMGVSVNPLLSKLASGIRKPGTANVLYPWDGPILLRTTKLRCVPGLGSRTFRCLLPCLREMFPDRSSDENWTCGDLVQVSQHAVEQALRMVPTFSNSASEIAKALLNKCRGIDDTPVVDDEGRLPLTVSVENSFRRGSVRTAEAVLGGMQDLYRRLPRLLHDRWSLVRDFPKTVRLTVRFVDQDSVLQHHRRRPFVTKSQQSTIDGRRLLEAPTLEEQQVVLKSLVTPLLKSLMTSIKLDITRINIALVDFQTYAPSPEKSFHLTTQTSIRTFPTQDDASSANGDFAKTRRSPLPSSKVPDTRRNTEMANVFYTPSNVDPSILAELPPEIADEVRHAMDANLPSQQRKRSRMEDFFAPRRSKKV